MKIAPLLLRMAEHQTEQFPVAAALLQAAVQQFLVIAVEDVIFVLEIPVEGGTADLRFFHDFFRGDLLHIHVRDQAVQRQKDVHFRSLHELFPSIHADKNIA